MCSSRALARTQLIDSIREAAFLLGGSRRDHDPLLEMAQGVRFVLLGEATHGSQELYRERARITSTAPAPSRRWRRRSSRRPSRRKRIRPHCRR